VFYEEAMTDLKALEAAIDELKSDGAFKGWNHVADTIHRHFATAKPSVPVEKLEALCAQMEVDCAYAPDLRKLIEESK
jgi:ribosomal protein L7Ae-like RNA K-turn-binding protein